MDKIGQRIKKMRQEKGLSLRELGEKINIAFSHLSRIENDKKTPNIELLETLSDLFDVPMSYFFGEEQPLPKELKEKDVEWLVFGEEMEKRDLTPEEIKNIVELVDKLRKK